MEINLASIRQEYTKGGLRESELPDNPFLLFSQWLQEAIDSKVDEPTAMLVGTVSPEGKPSTRTVLLKDLHDDKFIFYSNYESRKGRQLAQNPAISLSFVWHQLERQVHIEGTAEKSPRMNRINISKNARIKAGSELVYPHKVNPSAAVCNLYELSLERQLVGLEKKWSVRLTGAGMPSFPNVSSSGKVGPTGFMIA